MYPFGCEPSRQAHYDLPPAMSPQTEFLSQQYYYDGPFQDDLLTTFMSTEIANADDIFEDYPLMVAEEFTVSNEIWQSPSRERSKILGFCA